MNINDDDHHRDWSSLPWLVINCTSKLLNAIEHVHFRSVCSEWRAHTEERQKAPLIILIDQSRRDDTIKAIALFDLIGKQIITLPYFSRFSQGKHHYLGSSHGLIFIGRIHNRHLKIKIVSPLTGLQIDIPPLAHKSSDIGRVFLLGGVGYPFRIIHYRRNAYGAYLHFLTFHEEDQWTLVCLKSLPDDIVATKAQLFANYNGVLYEVSLETKRLSKEEFLLPGLYPVPDKSFDLGDFIPSFSYVLSSDSAHFLKFFEDLYGQLHLFTSCYITKSNRFRKVAVIAKGKYAEDLFEPPVSWKPCSDINSSGQSDRESGYSGRWLCICK